MKLTLCVIKYVGTLDSRYDSLVSIIVLCYNQKKYVKYTLDSIRDQLYKNIEIILIDDASSDGSREVIKEWIKTNRQIRLYSQLNDRNLGICLNLNYALTRCKGEYVQLIASDDLLHSAKIDRQVKLFQNINKRFGIVFSDVFLINVNGQVVGKTFDGKKMFCPPDRLYMYEELLKVNFVHPVSILIKKDLFKTVGVFDENLSYEDTDWLIRAALITEFFYDDQIYSYYRVGIVDQQSNLFNENHLASLFKIYLKNYRLKNNSTRIILKRLSSVQIAIARSNYSQYLENYLMYKNEVDFNLLARLLRFKAVYILYKSYILIRERIKCNVDKTLIMNN